MPIACTNCGGKVAVPEGHSRPKIRCTLCGYYTVVPADQRSAVDETPEPDSPKTSSATAKAKAVIRQAAPAKEVDQHARKAKPNRNAIDPRPNFESDTPLGPNLLDGDEVEADDLESTTPYAVPGTGIKKCPDCRGELPLDATLCVHCGMDLTSKQKKGKREFTPLYREWEPYLPFDLRMKVFIGMQIFNVVLFVISVTVGWSAAFGFSGVLVQTALQAFLLGTFDRLVVTRTAKGKADVQKKWRVFFVPIQPQKVDWRVSHGVAVVPKHEVGVFEWMMMVYLLFCGILPGLLFYWYAMKPERFDVVLCDVHGSTDQMIFRTSNREMAVEICSTISEVTTLEYRKVV